MRDMSLDRTKFTMKGNGLDVARTWPEKAQPLEVGDSIEGKYVEKLENVGSHESNVYVLLVGGERVGVWGSTVIDENMKDVETGVLVGFEFSGKRTGKSGSTYNDFRVGIATAPEETSPAPADATGTGEAVSGAAKSAEEAVFGAPISEEEMNAPIF